ncbi:MAG: DUF3750 domain-containing protein [Chromatiaceae bacterium]|jgi:hypothetical protein
MTHTPRTKRYGFLRWIGSLTLLVGLLLIGPGFALLFGDIDFDTHWSEASLDSAGIAPDPLDTPEAVVQVYAARAYNWRGAFGSHSWISVKPQGSRHYTVYQLVGWRLRYSPSAISIRKGGPADFFWFNAKPRLLVEHRGRTAQAMIPLIEQAVKSYPYPHQYRVWPGPNSNTFVAWVARKVPALRLDLPATAIGKDYLANGDWLAAMPSGTGWQVSLYGLLGLGVAKEEGIEFNLLGLSFGVDVNDLALRVPGWGAIPAAN